MSEGKIIVKDLRSVLEFLKSVAGQIIETDEI